MLSISRIVTLLTPTVFAPAAAIAVGWLGQHAGVHLSANDVTALEAAGFVGACGVVGKWLHGLQKHEHDVRAAQIKFDPAALLASSPPDAPASEPTKVPVA